MAERRLLIALKGDLELGEAVDSHDAVGLCLVSSRVGGRWASIWMQDSFLMLFVYFSCQVDIFLLGLARGSRMDNSWL